MARQGSPTSPDMVTKETHLHFQREVHEAQTKLSDRIASIAVDMHKGNENMSTTMKEFKHEMLERDERNRAEVEAFKQTLDDLKSMLSSRRSHSSSSASSHRSSRHTEYNNDHLEHTRTLRGKELQDRVMERDKRQRIEREVQAALHIQHQHREAQTHNARMTRQEEEDRMAFHHERQAHGFPPRMASRVLHGEPSQHHVHPEDRHTRPPPPPRQDDPQLAGLHTTDGRPHDPRMAPFDHQDYYNDNLQQYDRRARPPPPQQDHL